MNKWEITAQKAWEAILEKVKTLYSQGMTDQKIADLIGAGNRSVITEWRKGNRKAINTTFANLMSYLEKLDLDYESLFPATVPTIKRPGPYAPIEKVEGEDLPVIPVMGSTGAGDAVEIFSQTPDYLLPVPERYYRVDMIGLVVDGVSMEPTIQRGSIVGIMPYDGSITEGGIYLIQRPPFGRTIKRIRMGSDGEILLVSDNPTIGPITLLPEGYEQVIKGRVVWIWQMC